MVVAFMGLLSDHYLFVSLLNCLSFIFPCKKGRTAKYAPFVFPPTAPALF
jgi:hypothetical protein